MQFAFSLHLRLCNSELKEALRNHEEFPEGISQCITKMKHFLEENNLGKKKFYLCSKMPLNIRKIEHYDRLKI